jgi:hypothetical protein
VSAIEVRNVHHTSTTDRLEVTGPGPESLSAQRAGFRFLLMLWADNAPSLADLGLHALLALLLCRSATGSSARRRTGM